MKQSGCFPGWSDSVKERDRIYRTAREAELIQRKELEGSDD